MLLTRFFFLLCLIPSLLCADFYLKEHNKVMEKISKEWNRHTELVQRFSGLPFSEREQNLGLLHEAIGCCQRAISHCDHILQQIADKRKTERKDWEDKKQRCKQDKQSLHAEIAQLQTLINNTITLGRVSSLYQESGKKAQLGLARSQQCPRHLDNVEEVVAALNEASRLYEEAVSLAREALNQLPSHIDQESKQLLNQAIATYQEAADRFKRESAEWPAVVLSQKMALDEQPNTVKEEDSLPLLSTEEFRVREEERKNLFFKSDLLVNSECFLEGILQSGSRSSTIALDGQIVKKGQEFTLYAEQFYRFLVKSDVPLTELCVGVYENGTLVHEELITLPVKETLAWDCYLLTDGAVWIPETQLKTNFGLDLRLQFICDPAYPASLMISQKGSLPQYQFSFSLKDKIPLYDCYFAQPPPWQLNLLKKPPQPEIDRLLSKKVYSLTADMEKIPFDPPEGSFPILDQFVEQLQRDPMALAGYVHHEIALDHRFPYQEEGIFQASGIQRNPSMTFLEKRGSAWEQCQLLVYLLRKAGYRSMYVVGDPCRLPKTFVEKLLLTKLPEGQTEGLLNYPWVIFFDGKEWISLFPWMKQMQLHEGYDLYNLMPEEYATADRWILRYLKGDAKIVKQIGSDKDDSLGILFVRFVEENLRKQGLSLSDIGIHRTQIKQQFSSWTDFPQPELEQDIRFFRSLNQDSSLFGKARIDIFSHENPQKKLSQTFALTDLNCNAISLRFEGKHFYVQFIGEQEERLLNLDQSDRTIDIQVCHENMIGSRVFRSTRTLSMAKETDAALCFHLGGGSSQITSQFYQQFSSQQEEKKRLHALLAFVGAAYFEKCGSAEKILAELHKIPPTIDFAFGLVKLCPVKDSETRAPQVDMRWCPSSLPSSICWQQDIYSALRQFENLFIVDSSSNEHQILLDVFGVKEAISTVKLLQLAHCKQYKIGSLEPSFLKLTSSSMTAAEATGDLDFSQIKAASCGQWDATKAILNQGNSFDSFAYAYMTPGLVCSPDGSYQEMGSLVFRPFWQAALISSNNLIFHGGLGSPLPQHYFTPSAIQQWQLVPQYHGDSFNYSLQVPSSLTPPAIAPPLPETGKWISDVRLGHKSLVQTVSDPVDVVTGAFYVDEIDLVLPGPFPLEIRRNYNSKQPLVGDFGCGWKLSLNPFLIEQEGKLYAAEADGTVIAYSYNPQTLRWEVFPEENPDLYHFNPGGTNPFHACIKDEILYGTDGSRRIFEKGLLKQWTNPRGNTLIFSYTEGKLSCVESSNGDFCRFLYNHEGKIAEIHAKDGRRLSYSYNHRGDLIKVTLPNTATITYEYDAAHQIIRETKPHGKVLENVYEKGKVKEQRSPMGLAQAMIPTATFDYAENITTVTDAEGGKTTYHIFHNQIYRIIDPLGYETLQSWFIDKTSWFDPQTEKIVVSDQSGGAVKSLKASTDKRGLTTHYLYDKRGNPEEIQLKGCDLTGSGETSIVKKFSYNANNLCICEETAGYKTTTLYDTIFPYLPKKIENYVGSELLSFVEWSYNAQGLIEKEDRSGAVTSLNYDPRGFPRQKTQVTGTDDPDVVTTYAYNNQGRCIQLSTVDDIQYNDYDIMGNLIQSQVFSHSGNLLSALYFGYDLNNQPIWKQTANPNNTLYLDYHASGLLKASRETFAPDQTTYTLWEYNGRGDKIHEVDPRGFTTYRDYNDLGQMIRETKEGLSSSFTYEPGGLLASITSPSEAKTTRLYTTSGLLKEEIYPDRTQHSIVYDFFARPIRETQGQITWEITYDDVHHRVIRTHAATRASEIREFDLQGNLIRLTDPAGYTSEKTYDQLNRLKTETLPNGEQTCWNYRGDTTICTHPSGEKRIERYEGGRLVESTAVDALDKIIAASFFFYDSENDLQYLVQGDRITTTWLNSAGLPIKVEKGDLTTTYSYDSSYNCIAITDGDGKTTHQTFDGLKRMTRKELSDGSLIAYTYDLDSNMTECHLPNGTLWRASYDSMRRKVVEELVAGTESSQCWEYTYEKGQLTKIMDPLQRIHQYSYTPEGRLAQETADGWERRLTYDPRGLVLTAEQIGPEGPSQVERVYDDNGRLIAETISLNSQLLQHTEQAWQPSGRSLSINGHTRHFTYQNEQLAKVITPDLTLSYGYNFSGSLTSKTTPLTFTTLDYNESGLPEEYWTYLPNTSYEESLLWTPSGKLSSYLSPQQQKQFTYTQRGFLKNAGTERYEFDFDTPGNGVRTAAPEWTVPQSGLDPFGAIINELHNQTALATAYDLMGQTIFQNNRQLQWDPWGRLIKISDPTFTWEASYDFFGRRLQTRYTPSSGPSLTTTSLYDPEEEFQEIGVKFGTATFWKIYGPNSCDAVTGEAGNTAFLIHNALHQLAAIVSQQGTFLTEEFPSSYGPQSPAPISIDLFSYAQSLAWHSSAQDPTGLIWMGARYYDPRGGRFLSPDPIGYPACLDLYAFAGGDPINYMDPDGRFFSPVYQPVKSVAMSIWSNPLFQGSAQAMAGFAETSVGAAMLPTPFAPLGAALIVHGSDHFVTGSYAALTGNQRTTATTQLLQKIGMSAETATYWDNNLNFVATLGIGGLIHKATRGARVLFCLPMTSTANLNQINRQILFGQRTVNAYFSEAGIFGPRPISEIVQELRNGTISPNALPLEIIIRGGKEVTLNNRSLLALRRANMEPTVVMNRTGIAKYEDILDYHLKGSLPSDVIRVRGGPPGTSLITPTPK